MRKYHLVWLAMAALTVMDVTPVLARSPDPRNAEFQQLSMHASSGGFASIAPTASARGKVVGHDPDPRIRSELNREYTAGGQG
jgi:hypothetical protein